MSQIQIMLCSLENLLHRELWAAFFADLEQAIGARLSHLDTNDPVRRKVSTIEEAAGYVCDIGDSENSRTVFAKFQKVKVEMTITLFRNNAKFANNVSIYFPNKALSNIDGLTMLNNVFALASKKTQPFYAVCDTVSTVSGKRKLSGFAVNLQAELIGVFWLTYLNKGYVDYFGVERFSGLPCQKIDGLAGTLIKLGRSPIDLSISRDDAERLLGVESFVDPMLNSDKPAGKHALEFDQLMGIESAS